MKERCESCKPDDDETNHPPGMVFVGWGRGWEPCPVCKGSGLVDAPCLAAERETGE